MFALKACGHYRTGILALVKYKVSLWSSRKVILCTAHFFERCGGESFEIFL